MEARRGHNPARARPPRTGRRTARADPLRTTGWSQAVVLSCPCALARPSAPVPMPDRTAGQ